MIQYIFHYYTKIRHVGLARFYNAARARLSKHRFLQGKRSKHLQLTPRISRNILSYLSRIALQERALLERANIYARNQFSVLGSHSQHYSEIPWYTDVRLKQSDTNSDYSFDMKVPWELARFQYTPILAHAYAQTKNALYLNAIKKQIISFLDAAPFLEGIHWSNPMECAIRATNWIVAYHIVGDELRKDVQFHKQFVNSLWQHMLFIERNWELYDGRTNNHYLSNLVGYAYLCSFFNDAKRWKHCWKELQSEFAWQIQDDGSSYEGSTAYHKLVTELFVHGLLVAQQMGENTPSCIRETLTSMLQFADATGDLCIGDDDSGSLLYPGLYDLHALARNLITVPSDKKHAIVLYKQFGLSIITTNQWKISLRHHAYYGRQPSAHFHEDVGSVTLSYKGIPILVDPGSYLYTGSKKWRNYFRSAAQHSTFYPVGWNQKGDDLFALHIPEGRAAYEHTAQSVRITHSLYGFPVSRTVSWSDDAITIQDDVCNATTQMEWQCIFAPGIALQKNGNGGWNIMHNSKCILQFHCDALAFEKRETWVSPSYGVKQKAWVLQAKGALSAMKSVFYCNKS